jgi:hypothetical protein
MGSKCKVCDQVIEFEEPVLPILQPERIILGTREGKKTTDWPAWTHHGFVHFRCVCPEAQYWNEVVGEKLAQQLLEAEDQKILAAMDGGVPKED